jgi:hypothetical protein
VDNPLNGPRALRTITLVFLALVLVGVVAGLARSFTGSKTGAAPTLIVQPGQLPGELTSRAPWPANTPDLRGRLAALGLPALSQEGTVLHVHQHLDVFVAGRHVVVPAGIGIDPDGRFISPIHTHDATGVIHVESPTLRPFTLGELFGVWGVRFDSRCLGGYCTGRGGALRVYANGEPVSDPQLLELTEHEEIVVTFGTTRQLPRPLPASYDFPSGL